MEEIDRTPETTKFVKGNDRLIFRYASEVTLLYKDKMDNLYEQPASDLVECGTLIDPEDGEDLMLIGIYTKGGRY
jgi:hypothetical protein